MPRELPTAYPARVTWSNEPPQHPFTVREGFDAGLSRRHLQHTRFFTPFYGVRSLVQPTSPLERARAGALRLREWQALSGVSAAAVWGLPVRGRAAVLDEVTVIGPNGRSVPSARGYRSRRIDSKRLATTQFDGLRVTTPLVTWATLAEWCQTEALIVTGEALLASADNYPGLRTPVRPLARLEEAESLVEAWQGSPGVARLREALAELRCGVESPKETELRRLLVRAGLPEPSVNIRIPRENGRHYRGDLAYETAKVLVEYDGKGHLTEQSRWESDITRLENLAALGWSVIRVTNRMLRCQPLTVVERVRRALVQRRR